MLELTKSMPISKYFEVVRPVYSIFKIIPHSSCRNYNTSAIASVMSTIKATIRKEEKKYFIESKLKCTYMIDIYKNDVQFYFIVPSQFKVLLKDKLEQTWSKATIEEIPSVNGFSATSILYEIKYKNHDALAVTVDKKSNALLNSVLNVVDVMELGDRVTILYNFTQANNWGWSTNASKVQDKWMQNIRVPKTATKGSIAFDCICFVLDFIERFLDEFMGTKAKDLNVFTDLNESLRQKTRKLSQESISKRNDVVIDTQIGIVSHSDNIIRANNNALITCQGFYALKGDNEFEYERKVSCNISPYDTNIRTAKNKIGLDESSTIIQIPGKELLEKHHISHNNVTETNVPKDLQNGVMCLGESKCKDTITRAYLSTDISYQYLTWLLIGPTRAGKTTLISNACYSSAKAHECNIVIDWCKKCELSEDLKATLKDKIDILEINCSDFKRIEGLGYNEMYSASNDADERYESAKKQGMQLLTLINSLQGGDEDLRARMERYLGASSLVVAMSNGPIKDVFEVLQDHEIRERYISMIPTNQEANMTKYVRYLNELNEVKNGAVIGTKLNAVQGILNRVNKLEQNTYMEKMLQKDCSNNINLIDEMQKGKLILIKMPERMFATVEEKDVYATYWLTKIWGALQRRGDDIQEKDAVKVNIYFDELYQVENCQEFLKSKLSQIAKFWAKPIISCHYLGQIGGIRNELKSANASYTLISGSDKDNYKELKSELYPYTEEDLLNLKRWHAIHLIKCNDGYGKFITALPKPIK